MSKQRRARRLLGVPPSEPAVQPPLLNVLTALNDLAFTVRSGFDDRAAAQIAKTAKTVLGARAVAVTNDREVLATTGTVENQWSAAIMEQTSAVVDRQRLDRPTVYEVSLGDGPVEVAVAPLLSEDVLIGTVHAAHPVGGARVAELDQFVRLLSAQLQLAELDQSRAHAAEAQLQALRAQVSPHFIHNSLTAIAGLVNTDPGKARELIATFAEFLRASFRERAELTSVAEELRLVEAYLELEQARFGSRFSISLNIAPEALPVRLPFLSIQPIVENAIRHGLESRPGDGTVRIVAENAGPEVAIFVEDDGVGIDPMLLERALSGGDTSSHVGILAVDTRLRSTFGQEYGLTIETGKNAGTKVTIRLPKYIGQKAGQ